MPPTTETGEPRSGPAPPSPFSTPASAPTCVFAGRMARRLALKAAAASARIARRGEDEAMLRDAFFLRHGGADPGPGGRMLRGLAQPRSLGAARR